jgi:energy-coupling factor transporter ATP-binding protein EcfA2
MNVFCGRNNSGKSTLLSAIANSEARFVGETFESTEYDEIVRRSLPFTGWRGQSQDESLNLIFGGLCSRILASRAVWFKNDDDLFANEVVAAYSADWALKRYAIEPAGVARSFRAQFAKDKELVLLPPKRSLELNRPIALNDPIHPDGSGILNFLFLAKNQPSADPDRKLHDCIASEFVAISDGFSFEVFPNRQNAIQLRFSFRGRDWVPATACGLGLQDLLVILYFALAPNADILLIEEPESHLHPAMQHKLLSFLRERTNKQYFLTTHSNVFANKAFVDRVFFTTFDGVISVTDETSRASILEDLGYSVTDNLLSDLVILVEGPTDKPVIEEFLRKADLYGRFEIKIWPLGGDIMDQVDLSVFAEKYNMLALVDRDPGSSHVRKRFAENCASLGIESHRLSRYALENYFTLAALRAVFKGQVSESIDALDPDVPLDRQLGFSVKRNNRKIAQAMSLSDISATDFQTFVDAVRAKLGAS